MVRIRAWGLVLTAAVWLPVASGHVHLRSIQRPCVERVTAQSRAHVGALSLADGLDDAQLEILADLLTFLPFFFPFAAVSVIGSNVARARAEAEAAELRAEAASLGDVLEQGEEALSELSILRTEAKKLKEQLQSVQAAEAECNRTLERLMVDSQREVEDLQRSVRAAEKRLDRAVIGLDPSRPRASSKEEELLGLLGRGNSTARALAPGLASDARVLVTGAPSDEALFVIRELMDRMPSARVRVVLRNSGEKARRRFEELGGEAIAKGVADGRLEVMVWNLADSIIVDTVVEGVDAVLWLAAGPVVGPSADGPDSVGSFVSAVATLSMGKMQEDVGVAVVCDAWSSKVKANPKLAKNMTPKFVYASRAMVTRATWSAKRRAAYADIVPAQGPSDALSAFRSGERTLRESGLPYTVVRPCGLGETPEAGRVVLTTGDVATGKISSSDFANLVVGLLKEPLVSLEDLPRPGAAACDSVNPTCPTRRRHGNRSRSLGSRVSRKGATGSTASLHLPFRTDISPLISWNPPLPPFPPPPPPAVNHSHFSRWIPKGSLTPRAWTFCGSWCLELGRARRRELTLLWASDATRPRQMSSSVSSEPWRGTRRALPTSARTVPSHYLRAP